MAEDKHDQPVRIDDEGKRHYTMKAEPGVYMMGSKLRRTIGAKDEDFPSYDFPVIFSDSVASASAGKEVVKFFLTRADPHPYGEGGASNIPILEIVMPTSGFCQSTEFMVRVVLQAMKDGHVPTGVLERLTALVEEYRAAK